jgi:predicted DNA-binding protein
MKGFTLKRVRPEIPKVSQTKYETKLSPVGLPDETRARLTIVRKEGHTEADIVREALRLFLDQFFEEAEG